MLGSLAFRCQSANVLLHLQRTVTVGLDACCGRVRQPYRIIDASFLLTFKLFDNLLYLAAVLQLSRVFFIIV